MHKPKTLVIQPRSGIGDMIWHLPMIRAIAREVEGGPVYLLTKSKALAKSWLYNEPSIAVIDYLDRRNMMLAGMQLRHFGFHSAWILHESVSYALAACTSGALERIGPGAGAQRYFLTNASLPEHELELSHIEQMHALLAQQKLNIRVEDQRLTLDPAAQAFVRMQIGHLRKPWVTLGIGASDEFKMWPIEHFITLARKINVMQKSTFFVCGSRTETDRVQMVTQTLKQNNIDAVAIDQFTLPQVFALLAEANFFIGNDSSLMNASACLGVPSIGLFGATEKLVYSPYIHPILSPFPQLKGFEGMRSILPEQVFAYCIERQLLQEQKSNSLGIS